MDGFDGVSLNSLSAQTGLSKASLYHHFPNGKLDMALSVLADEGRLFQKAVLAPLQRPGGGGASVRHMFDGVRAYYRGDVPVCMMNLFIHSSIASVVGPQIQATVKRWEELLAERLYDIGIAEEKSRRLATVTVCDIQGALILSRVFGQREPLEQAIKTSLERLSLG
ncbi:TetR family transcriptional regulator [Kordiimonas sediminis]|uniref:TetR family transcriptional regulator n=1 Tax=Kordiimonas sediminis TaxID=1735581 RepID=A0A919ALZ0_9PROT|nr:TetR family transcriptional regulator [Kordiimonas sediminis]